MLAYYIYVWICIIQIIEFGLLNLLFVMEMAINHFNRMILFLTGESMVSSRKEVLVIEMFEME